MTDTLVLHPYVPGYREADQEATWASLRDLTRSPLGNTVVVRSVEVGDDTRYPDALTEAWTWPGPLVVVEHDVAPTLEQWETLLRCRHSACAFSYRLPKPPVWSHRHWKTGEIGLLARSGGLFTTAPGHEHRVPSTAFGQEGDERADLVGFGFIRLSVFLRGLVGLPPLPIWYDTDTRICAAVCERLGRGQFNLHWPEVAHAHTDTQAATSIYAAEPVKVG